MALHMPTDTNNILPSIIGVTNSNRIGKRFKSSSELYMSNATSRTKAKKSRALTGVLQKMMNFTWDQLKGERILMVVTYVLNLNVPAGVVLN